MKAILYARTATNQDHKPNKSIQNQLARLADYAKEQNLKIDGVYYDIASGIDFNRHQFKQMMQDIQTKEKKAKLIICTSSDRFCRSFFTAVELLQSLQKAGVEIKFLDDSPGKIEYRRTESEILGSYYKSKKKK